MNNQIKIYDTTLRDGSQGEGINFSVNDKIRIAEKLNAFGIHFIEGGWPGSNPRDVEFFKEASQRSFKNALLTAFGSTRRKKTPVQEDEQVRLLLEAQTPAIAIFGKSWLLHIKEVLKTTPAENLAMVADTVAYLKAQGRCVIFDAEHAIDGFKDDPEYALSVFKAAAEAGADWVVLCDTNGGSLPSEVSEIVSKVLPHLGKSKLGIHTHNDAGLAVANALAAVEKGARMVQGTINGYGERTGNCNLTSVIPSLSFKMKLENVPAESLPKLKQISQFVDEIANMRPDPRQPWVGASAFAHKGGMHVNAVHKLASTFEHIDPACVGNSRRVLVSDLAGKSNIVMKAKELGIHLDDSAPELKTILTYVKQMEHQGFEFESAEASLILLIQKTCKKITPPFTVGSYHVSMRSDGQNGICEATVKVKVGDKVGHTVADGEGPVNALDGALRAALLDFYPALKNVQLLDYKVRILQSSSGTAARTRVLIESTNGIRSWGTVGVSENIIEASLQALVDSLEYWLLRERGDL
jgi:2-isopropylmalate synthase